MTPPVLRVKKGALVYDDASQQEPPERPADPSRQPSRGRSRRILRRASATFLPLAVIAIALLVLLRYLPGAPRGHASLQGWDLTLRAMPYEGDLLVGVTFIRQGAALPEGSGAQAPVATVKFLARETGEGTAAVEALARSPMTVGGKLPYSPGVRNVAAEVTIGSKKAILAVALRAPK